MLENNWALGHNNDLYSSSELVHCEENHSMPHHCPLSQEESVSVGGKTWKSCRFAGSNFPRYITSQIKIKSK